MGSCRAATATALLYMQLYTYPKVYFIALHEY
jgi:hypothetical protein